MSQVIRNNLALSFRRESAIILPFSSASAKVLPLPFSFPITSQFETTEIFFFITFLFPFSPLYLKKY